MTAEVKVVPVEPTEAMIEAFHRAIDRWMTEAGEDGDIWLAMLAATPPAETGEGEDLAGKLTAIRDKFLIPTPDKDFTDYAIITRCIAALSAQSVSPSEGEAVRGTIFKALRRYKLTNMSEADDSGIGYPLVDLMSNDGTTIATGEAEMLVLADHISEALGKASTHPASDQSDTERMRATLTCIRGMADDAAFDINKAGVTLEGAAHLQALQAIYAASDAALAEKAADQ